MKRIGSLFLLAVLSFFVFSYIDEYENLIAPFFSGDKGGAASPFQDVDDRGKIRDFLLGFNERLSAVYLSPDRPEISRLPASEEVKNDLYEEIGFLKGKKLTMGYRLDALDILEIKRLSAVATQVKTKEKVRIGYRTDNSEQPSSYSDAENEVTYTLIAGPEGLMVAAFEVAPVAGEKGK